MAPGYLTSDLGREQAEGSYIYIYNADQVITSPDITIKEIETMSATETITRSGPFSNTVHRELVRINFEAPEGAEIKIINCQPVTETLPPNPFDGILASRKHTGETLDRISNNLWASSERTRQSTTEMSNTFDKVDEMSDFNASILKHSDNSFETTNNNTEMVLENTFRDGDGPIFRQMDSISDQMKNLVGKMDKIGSRLDRIDNKLDRMIRKLDYISSTLDSIADNIDGNTKSFLGKLDLLRDSLVNFLRDSLQDVMGQRQRTELAANPSLVRGLNVSEIVGDDIASMVQQALERKRNAKEEGAKAVEESKMIEG